MAKANPFRFSTKYQDDETDLLYYGYRYYNASTGRWISRDPIAERGGRNLLAFISNDPVDAIDRLGKQCCLITVSRGPNSVMGHSILACDNGTYVSKSAEGETNPQWRTPQQDYSQDPDIGFPGSTFTTNCIPCVDESKVKLWFENNKASQWSYGNNCANAALDAIEAGLPDPQTKPSCCRPNTYARNLLRELRNGMTPAFATPTYVQGRVDEFNSKNKDCNKWRCTEYLWERTQLMNCMKALIHLVVLLGCLITVGCRCVPLSVSQDSRNYAILPFQCGTERVPWNSSEPSMWLALTISLSPCSVRTYRIMRRDTCQR